MRPTDNARSCKDSLLPQGNLSSLPDILIAARIARLMTQKELAEAAGLKMQQIQLYEKTHYKSASFKRILLISEVLGVTIDQSARLAGSSRLAQLDLSSPYAFPIGEMIRRQWLRTPSRLWQTDPRIASDLLATFFNATLGEGRSERRRFARMRTVPHEPVLSVWEAKVIQRADAKRPIAPFDRSRVDQRAIKDLLRLSQSKHEISSTIKWLRDFGIVLLTEAALPSMAIDSAAIRTPSNVFVIALTLRDPSFEVFWIALMHELTHIALHLSTGSADSIFDDLSASSDLIAEEEADVHAREATISSAEWQRCASQYEWTRKAILADSRRLGIGPAIITGYIKQFCGGRDLPKRMGARDDISSFLADGDPA